MMFQTTMQNLAKKTNCLCSIEGNTAYLIEKDSSGRPSKDVWRKTFILSGNNVTVKVHGRTLTVVPLASLN